MPEKRPRIFQLEPENAVSDDRSKDAGKKPANPDFIDIKPFSNWESYKDKTFFYISEEPLLSPDLDKFEIRSKIFNLNKEILLNFEKKESPFFIPIFPSGIDKKNSFKEKPKRDYVPITDVKTREDLGFYQTFYTQAMIGLFADYDDLVAALMKNHPGLKWQFNPESGEITTGQGKVDLSEINRFVQTASRLHQVPLPTLDPEGSLRRLEEREFFKILEQLDLNSHATSLYQLDRLGLLAKAVPGVSGYEINSNKLTEVNRKALRKFYAQRQRFWHPDLWHDADGLTQEQKAKITKMSAKLNCLVTFI